MTVLRATIVVLLSATWYAEATVVRLLPAAKSAKSIVTLGDVSEILATDEALKKTLANVELGPAPEKGQSRWIDLTDIKERLYRRGLRMDDIEFAGSRRVEVSVSDSAPAEPVESEGIAPWREAIIRVVRDSMSAESFPLLAKDCRQEDIRIRTEADRACTFLSEQKFDRWHLVAPARWQEGWQEILLEVETNGETTRFPIRILIAPARPVVSMRSPVAAGKKIRAEDVVIVTHELQAAPQEYLFNVESAVGLEAKRDMVVGEPIRLRDMRQPPVVFRGQPVTVRVSYGSAWLQKTFIAGSDAGVGEWIEVSEAGARANRTHDYQVRVTGPHAAVLPIDAPPSRAVLNGLPQAVARKAPRQTRK